jgi:hypothetical protein
MLPSAFDCFESGLTERKFSLRFEEDVKQHRDGVGHANWINFLLKIAFFSPIRVLVAFALFPALSLRGFES